MNLHRRMICKVLGDLLLLETAMILTGGAVSLYYEGKDLPAFLCSALITALAGGILLFFGKHAERQLTRRAGYHIFSLARCVYSLFRIHPYLLSGYIPRPVDAFFETMSGVSSTGASILDNIEALPHGLLFWRSMTQWIGGLGIVLFTIAVLPIFGVNGVQVFAAEATGPTKEKVHPRIGIAARWIWTLYLSLTLVCAVLLWLGGMSGFDAVCHSMTTTSTGGFSTHQDSIAYFHSPYIEYVLSAFMLVSGINFSLILLFCTGRFKKMIKDVELRFYLGCLLLATLFCAFWLYQQQPSLGGAPALRTALFQVISIQTSTGFATSDYMTWPQIAWGIMPLMMLTGACAGSTSGGMKCIRMVILSKVSQNEFKRLLHPNAVLPVRINRQVIAPTLRDTVLAFTFLFVVITFVCILTLMGMGLPFLEATGIVVSSMGNTGPGLGAFGPAFSWNALPDAAKWLASFLMLLGRLELFTVLLIFTPDFWRK